MQVELVVDEMRRSLTRRAGVNHRLPQFVGMSGFQDYAINIVVLVSHALRHKTCIYAYSVIGACTCSRHMGQLLAFCHKALMMLQLRWWLLTG
jgi:hypothetical protein